MYERILDSFREDQIALDKPADFTDKRNDLETKFKKEEIKKGDKQIKKDMNEWEDLYEGGPGLRKNEAGITKLADKINKMMTKVPSTSSFYNLVFRLYCIDPIF